MTFDGTASPPLLEADGLTKHYRHRRGELPRPALDGVDLRVGRGDRLGIVGGSGSGKSTLLRLLVALEAPSAGSVRFDGAPVTPRRSPQLTRLRRHVQIVFQDPRGSLDPRMQVATAIAEPLRALRLPVDPRARTAELLDLVGLPAAVATRYPHELSGGQRQRVAIARALAPRPDVLLADEPVSALDVSVRAQVLNLLDDLVARLSLSLVLVSHDLGVVRHLCTGVLVLHDGRVVEQGSAARICDAPVHPYTRRLLAATPRLHLKRRDGAP